MRFALAQYASLAASLVILAACDAKSGGGKIDPSAPVAEADLPASVAELDVQIKEAQDFVTAAGQATLVELRTSEMAIERAANADVKAFAQSMIDQNRAISDSLTAAAGGAALALPPDVLDDFHMRRINDLAEGDGDADFDADYMAVQVDAHADAIKVFEAYVKDGDIPQMKTFAEESLPLLREGRKKAEQVRAALAG